MSALLPAGQKSHEKMGLSGVKVAKLPSAAMQALKRFRSLDLAA